MKSLIRWTLWQRRWSIFWWSIGISAFVVLNMIFYPTIRDQAADFEKTFSQLSEGTKALFSDTGEFFSPVGFLSSQIFYLMMPLLVGILAIALGTSLIGREEREGTLDLLLARPLSRAKLLISKALSGILIVALIGLIGTFATLVMAQIVDIAVPLPNIFLTGLAAAALALSFGAIAFMITALGRTARTASIAIAALIAILGYILTSLAGSVDWLRWPAKAFPFNYYHPAEILRGVYDWTNMLFILGLVLACGLISWLAFRRRDIG
jgi:ABC-2 type transport system permease protein